MRVIINKPNIIKIIRMIKSYLLIGNDKLGHITTNARHKTRYDSTKDFRLNKAIKLYIIHMT